MKNLKFLLLSLTVLALYSCGGNSSNLTIDLIPVKFKEDGKISLMKLNGEIVLSDEFNDESDVFSSEGVILETKKNKVNYYKISDKKLTQINLDKDYEAGTPFFNGYALVRDKDGRLSFIEKSGKEKLNLSSITQVNIVRAGILSDDLIKVKSSDGYWGFINIKGEVVIKPEYVMVENFVNGRARVKTDKGKVLVIDKDNKTLFTGKNDFSYHPVSGNGELVFVENGTKEDYAGMITLKGDVVIKDSKFKEIHHMGSSKYMVVKNDDGLWGVVDKKGEYVGELRAKFERAPIIINNGFAVIDDKKIKYYDTDGKSTKQIDGYTEAFSIDGENLVAISERKNSAMILNSEGEEILKDDVYLTGGTWVQSFYRSRFLDNAQEFENTVSLESSFFDFEKNFKAVFSNINQNGVWGITNTANILAVEKAYNDLKARNTTKKATVKADRSLNYTKVFYYEKDENKITDTGNRSNTSGIDSSVAVEPSAPSADTFAYAEEAPDVVEQQPQPQVKDPYPFVGLYQSSHSLQSVHIGDITLSATAYFSDYIKTESYGEVMDPVFKEVYMGVTGYELNPMAQLKSLTISYSLDDYEMNQKFSEKFIDKLKKQGWSEATPGTLFHPQSGLRANISSGQISFYFNQ